MSGVYLVLSRSRTIPSRVIHLFTKDEYTHSSLSFSDTIEYMYSFARKYPRLILPGGLITERFDRGLFALQPQTKCRIYQIETDGEKRKQAIRIVEEMYAHKEKYGYSLLGVAFCKLGISRKRKNRYFCSEFVAEVLQESGIRKMKKDPSLIRPQDLMELNGMKLIYEGTVKEARRHMINEKISG